MLGLQVSVGAKPYGKILLMLGHFEFRVLKFQQIELFNIFKLVLLGLNIEFTKEMHFHLP